MAKRTTRNKIRWQVKSGLEDLVEARISLERAQKHLLQAAAIADDRSPIIDKYLPGIVTSIELVITTTEQFYEEI